MFERFHTGQNGNSGIGLALSKEIVYQWYATVNLGTIRFTASSLLRCCKIWNQERIRMINNLMYIELKMGYSDDDPAWIGYVKTSKSRIKIF